MRSHPIVAVVPFGTRAPDARRGAWARQIARRLVERLPADETIELRPVFVVTMPTEGSGEGHLILGSTPGPDLAAQYGASLGATHAVVGMYVESEGERRVEASLIDVATRAKIEDRAFVIASGHLHLVENEIGEWIAEASGARASREPQYLAPAVANEKAYAALLEAMDEEVNATLLRPSDAGRAAAALRAALACYVDAVRADPDAIAPEERVLVIAAEALERGTFADEIRALEDLTAVRPRSWRAHYLLGQLRAESGDANGAIVAFEHARSLHALPEKDLVRLAELYANAGARAPALAHLRRITPQSDAYGAAQELLAIISFQRGDLESGGAAFARAVERGTTSWELHASYGAALHARGETSEAVRHYEDALASGGPGAVRLNLARVLIASGDHERAGAELDRLLQADVTGEVAGHARRLRFGLREPALERDLERAGQAALAGDAKALDDAKVVFERALGVDPDLWEAHFGLGIVARQRGDAATAQSAFRRVLELSPDQPDALHELGVAHLMNEETADALRALDHAASLRPEDPAYLADAGFAHLRAGDLASARARLERAARLDANDPITKSYLGELERLESAGKRT